MENTSERLERLQVLLLLQSMKGAPLKEKIQQLNVAGFSNVEIAEFVQTSPAVVATLLYESKRTAKAKKRKQ
jgi:hypothetical protein